ncbi:MAG: sugar transferase [Ardenticatenaceae bacterium]
MVEEQRLNTIQHNSLHDSLPKRLFDLTVATLGLGLLSFFLALIALAIKLYDGGPIFYRAKRVGKNGQIFGLYKFRTMVVNADKLGPGITANGDRRITPLGRFLRRTKLDELPQLLNVVRGQMSLVGPRPEDPRYVALYTPEQRQVLSVRPGITSAASLTYRHEEQLLDGEDWQTTYRNKVMPAKLAIDLAYLECRTFWSDLELIMRTVGAMFR